MIYRSLLEDGIADGIIQGPDTDDIGNDLEAIAQAVEDSHDEEVEDAKEGLIGEPVEEFAMVMYESEYNFNQIMEAIGMAELREACMGRELVLEAVDIKGFFRKIKEFFVKMFQSITEAVRKVLVKLDFQVKSDKKFVTANKTYIIEGSKGDWTVEGYPIDDKELEQLHNAVEINAGDNAKVHFEKLQEPNVSGTVLKTAIDGLRALLKDNTYIKNIAKAEGYSDVENMGDLRKAIHKELFGGDTKVNLKGHFTGEKVCDVLSQDREVRVIKAAHNTVKKSFAAIITDIKKWEANCAKSDDSSLYISAAQACVSLLKIERNAANIMYSEGIKAAKYKRNICRKLAHEFVNVSKQKGKYKPTNESFTGSLFDNVVVL